MLKRQLFLNQFAYQKLLNIPINRMLKVHSIQSHLRKPSQQNLFLTLHSQDAISIFIDDTASKKQININQSSGNITNIDQEDKKKCEKGLKVSRKHENKTVKKLGATLFNAFHHKKKMESSKGEFDYASIKQKIKLSSSKVLKSKHKITRSQLLQVRSLQLDQQLKALHTNRENEKIEKNVETTINNQTNRIQIQTIDFNTLSSVPEFVVQKSSKKFHRKLQLANQEQTKQNSKNGFYKKLKMKLQRQMQKIQAKKHQTKQNFIVEGLKVFKFDKQIEITRKPLTDRPRPQSSLTRTGLEFQTSQFADKDRRPKTSRSRTVQRKQIEYMSATADDILKRKPKSRPRTSRDNLIKKGQYHFQSVMNKTLKHVSPIYLTENQSVSKKQVRNQKIKEKMLTLLVECDNQTNQFSELDTGLRVFQSFTNRMNKGLSQVSKFLQDAQNMNDQYSQFLEK